ncbi:MAG: efflux RND transporter periplasmic adaptor subunit, partial [Selenomonadaceae bacterium]|nr:efflux RND transporter periplasmic adaptor subunit [Selenomonadaceae bacterium]
MNKKNNLISLLVAILIIITLTGCSKEQKSTPKPPLVKTIIAEQADSVNKNVYAGVVRGRYESNLSFQVGGRILSRNVQAGSFVRAGDALITLDQRDVIQQANQGDAQVTSRAAELELAKSNLSRYKELYDAGAVSASVLEQYQTNYNVALAAYENARAQAAQSHNALDYAYLTANADGVVSDVFVEVGQVVAAGQTALSLVQA